MIISAKVSINKKKNTQESLIYKIGQIITI